MTGFEPALPYGNWNLNPARLPIPPHPRAAFRVRVQYSLEVDRGRESERQGPERSGS